MSEMRLLQWTILLVGWGIVGAIGAVREWMRGNEGRSVVYEFFSTASLVTVLWMLTFGGSE